MYIAGKKKTQRRYLEKIIRNSGFEISLSPPDFEEKTNYLNLYSIPLKDYSLKEIFNSVFENAQKELEFYLFLKIVQKNDIHKTLLNMLIDLAGDFLFEVKIGYLGDTLKRDSYKHFCHFEHVISN